MGNKNGLDGDDADNSEIHIPSDNDAKKMIEDFELKKTTLQTTTILSRESALAALQRSLRSKGSQMAPFLLLNLLSPRVRANAIVF